MKSLLLASASPARRATLLSAGIDPLVAVSDVDEDALLAQFLAEHDPPEADSSLAAAEVQLLASAKAHHIADQIRDGQLGFDDRLPTVVVGCDSMLEMNGEIVGKPHTPDVARERLRAMSGDSGKLHTGHCVIDLETGNASEGVSTTTVHIGHLSEAEVEAYIGTGEPLHVAGSFTIDGFGGPFIDGIEGDHHGVVGISLPLLRRLLAEHGHSITEFWAV